MSWKAELGAALGSVLTSADPVAGGDINDAYRVRLADRRVVFVKTHRQPPAGMFAAEARGLDWLRTGALRVPEVLAVGGTWLALEWLELGERGAGFDEAFGRGLATLHRAGAPSFGLDHDNFLATLAQTNRATATWPELWIERRLRPLVEEGIAKGRIPEVRTLLDRLAQHPDRFGPPEPPARLHGDLWWGNVVVEDGTPIVIDPAVYGGHREVDLAMLALFGDLPDRLIAAYDEIWPLAEGWRQRRSLHQLVPLAAHAVLFGGGYGEQVRRVLTSIC